MRLVSNAKTLRSLQRDIVQYIELRAEQNRSAEKSVRTQAARKMYLHAACEIQSIADDVKFLIMEDGQ